MIFDVLTLFPGMFPGVTEASILGRAQASGKLAVRLRDFRVFGEGVHRKVDDTPCGGGPGMVLKCGPVFSGVRACLEGSWPGEPVQPPAATPRLVMMTPQGRPLTQGLAQELASEQHLVLLCGHYEGFDERIRLGFPWLEVSIGDYVLTGGELPAMVLIDAVARLLPGVLGDHGSAGEDSFSDGLLEYPQYTRPIDFEGMPVPPVLLGGNHGAVAAWRLEQAKARTRERRPDLWQKWTEANPSPPPKNRRRRKSGERQTKASGESPQASE
jgi:tRNA (guanine37-N1)-methyltransferase